jgi:hypothetical protein
MREHVFADETKAKEFALAAAFVMPEELAPLRSRLVALRPSYQRRLHFNHEDNGRRKMIIRSLIEANVRVRIYDGTQLRSEKAARHAAIGQLADDLIAMGSARLVLELDDTAAQNDRLIIRSRLLKAGCLDSFRYEHRRASSECLLAIPDAVAWCWARGREWRKCAEPPIQDVVAV